MVFAPSGNPATVQTPTPVPREQARRETHPGGLDANGGEVILRRLGAELFDLRLRRVGLQQRVVDERRDSRVAPRGAKSESLDAPLDEGPHGVRALSAREIVARARGEAVALGET